jgi:hypothetical protein
MKTSPSVANKGDHSMPTLKNPRHERFAQELATGKSADAAYVSAGYRANRSNAARLSANQDIQKRVAEIQSLGAERAAITVETLIAEAESARSKAMGEKGGAAAAVAAITTKAKLAGLWREKIAQTDPSGEHAPRYIISDRPMTEEEMGTGAMWGMNISCVHLRSLQRKRNSRQDGNHDRRQLASRSANRRSRTSPIGL